MVDTLPALSTICPAHAGEQHKDPALSFTLDQPLTQGQACWPHLRDDIQRSVRVGMGVVVPGNFWVLDALLYWYLWQFPWLPGSCSTLPSCLCSLPACASPHRCERDFDR